MKAELKELLRHRGDIVFFGGAGTSTESGIPDFRSDKGLYEVNANLQLPPETILSHRFFMRYPEHFFTFYRSQMIHTAAKPGAAHHALAALEATGRLTGIITQNIDGLHQQAGSKQVLELHGSIHRNYCMNCRAFYSLEELLASEKTVPYCTHCGAIIKPDVVLYEENLDSCILEKSVRAVEKADVLIVGGTSLMVNPAASLVHYFQGSKLVLINRTRTPFDSSADLVLRGSIGQILADAILDERIEGEPVKTP